MNNIVNNLIPDLRFPDYEDEFNKWTNFNSVVDSTLYGPRFNAKDYNIDGNVKTIRGTDVDNNGEFKYEQVPIAQIDESTVNTHKLLDGDLVMITTAECGQTGVFRTQNIDYISSAYGVRIRLNKYAYPEYFKYFFQTRHAKKEIASYVRKATVANLPGSAILKIKINLIPKKEQQKIANFLTTVDQRISLLKQKKAALEQYKKGLMQKIFSQEIRFKDDDGEDYRDWEEKRLGDVAELTSSKRVYLSDYVDSGVPFYRGKEISELKLNKSPTDILHISTAAYEQFKNKYGAPVKNDILITAVGTLGNVFRIRNNRKFYFKDGNLIWLRNISENPNFLERVIERNKKTLIKYSIGSTQKALTIIELNKIKFKFPILEEQQKIADCLSSMDQSINNLKEQIEQTIQFKKGLLQRMFV